MAYRALKQCLMGIDDAANPGDIIPETCHDIFGHEKPVDFERLVAIGAAEKVPEKAARPKAPHGAKG